MLKLHQVREDMVLFFACSRLESRLKMPKVDLKVD